MKKHLFYVAAAFAALAVTACSSDKDVSADQPVVDNGGGNYIAIGINLPSNPAANTRANDNGGNVTYDDGLPEEYAVKDATLVIFTSAGTFREAHTIDTKPWAKSEDDNVTRVSTKVVQPVSLGVVANDQLLVILNNNGLFEVTSSNGLKIKKEGTATDFNGTFTELMTENNKWLAQTSGLDCGDMKTTGFYMANAPLADTQGSTGTEPKDAKVQVLVPVTKVYPTEGEAAAGTADQIYVERGMAKVTMKKAITTNTLSTSKIDGTTNLKGTVTGWTLDNCNPTSYLVRSTDGHSDFISLISTDKETSGAAVYRYIGNTAISVGTPTTYKYRTYFAKSTNYDKSGMDAETPTLTFNRVTGASNFSDDFESPKYCFENTFSVDDQDVNKTTLVQVSIQAIQEGKTEAEDLYTIGANKAKVYTLTSLKTYIQGKAFEYIDNNSKIASGTLDSKDIVVGDITVDATNKVTAVALTYSTTSGATLKGSVLGGTDGTDDATNGTLIADVSTYVLDESGDILKYDKGVSYYNIRIKHFGDKLTPWKKHEKPGPSSTGGIYPSTDQANNYLGRYGVLRNNWYDLQVNSIKTLGEAVPHTKPWESTPDDELDNYITFQINILSWAKHETQKADL